MLRFFLFYILILSFSQAQIAVEADIDETKLYTDVFSIYKTSWVKKIITLIDNQQCPNFDLELRELASAYHLKRNQFEEMITYDELNAVCSKQDNSIDIQSFCENYGYYQSYKNKKDVFLKTANFYHFSNELAFYLSLFIESLNKSKISLIEIDKMHLNSEFNDFYFYPSSINSNNPTINEKKWAKNKCLYAAEASLTFNLFHHFFYRGQEFASKMNNLVLKKTKWIEKDDTFFLTSLTKEEKYELKNTCDQLFSSYKKQFLEYAFGHLENCSYIQFESTDKTLKKICNQNADYPMLCRLEKMLYDSNQVEKRFFYNEVRRVKYRKTKN
jgi:hypothetical protein